MKSLGQTDVRTTEQKVADETQASSTPAQVDAASTSKVDSAVKKQLDASDETRVVKAPKSGQTDRESLAVTLGLESFELHPDAPARRVWLPKSRPLPIRVTAPDGAYAGRIRPAMPMTREQPKLIRRRFEGRLIGNKLDLLGRALSRPIVILKKQAQGSTVKSDKKRFSWRVTSPGTANSWSFSVTDQTGRVLHQENGAGNPPAVLGWRPTEQFAKGTYGARLTVIGSRQVIQSAMSYVGIETKPQSTKPDPTISVSGYRATIADDGVFDVTAQLRQEAALVLDVEDKLGRWLVLLPATLDSNMPSAKGESKQKKALLSDAARRPTGANSALPSPNRTAQAAPNASAAVPGAVLQRALSQENAVPASRGPDALGVAEQKLSRVGARPTNLPLLDSLVPGRRQAQVEDKSVLAVRLPRIGEKLQERAIPFQGTTEPGRTVTVNGREFSVDERGGFGGSIPVHGKTARIEIVSEGEDGDRSIIKRTYETPQQSWFLMALGEGVTGTVGSELDGVQAHTSTEIGEQVYLHGRAVGWLRGYASGEQILGGLFKQYSVDAHVDTARRDEFSSAFRQLIDPTQFYPVYGDQSTEEKLINSNGPIYVLIKADSSRINVGNFRTTLKGIELFRYDRTHYGAQVVGDMKTGDMRHEVTVFGTDEETERQHGYVEFRGTGGSLYYLPHREVVEGSERVFLVEKDRLSGMERRRLALVRDQDYRIRYMDGRVMFTRPVSSSAFGLFGVQEGDLGQAPLDGHPIQVVVEYDHRDPTAPGDRSLGFHARESYKNQVSVGGICAVWASRLSHSALSFVGRRPQVTSWAAHSFRCGVRGKQWSE